MKVKNRKNKKNNNTKVKQITTFDFEKKYGPLHNLKKHAYRKRTCLQKNTCLQEKRKTHIEISGNNALCRRKDR